MKKVIIILIIVALIGVPVYLVLNTYNSQDGFYVQLNKFNALLSERNYQQAKLVYEQSNSTLRANYNISLDSHALSLIEEVKQEDTTQKSLDALYEYNKIGYDNKEINEEILYYEELLQSNYIFQRGVEHYNNDDFEQAMECFNDVLKYDENYQKARGYILSYQHYIDIWNKAKEDGSYGRSPSVNSIAYQDNFMYLSYEFSDANAILKVNTATDKIMSFPIISNDNEAVISDINIIDDYIFFLIQQNTPLADETIGNMVCRISTKGEDLVKIVDCDYTYMISWKDKFYALSPQRGIVMADKYLLKEEVLINSDDEIISMQLADDGIFYTTHRAEDNINTFYFYDGETSEEIAQEVNMHYYDYGVDKIIYYDITAFNEYIYQRNISAEATGNTWIYAGEVIKYYGMLNDSILYTISGDYQQECIMVRDIKSFRNTYRADSSQISYVPMGICYDAGLIVLKSEHGISLTTENMRIQKTIPLPRLNNSVLSENQGKTALSYDRFSAEAVEIAQENRWMYSDENISINTDKIYLDYIESTVYISDIYTKDYKWLKTEVIEEAYEPEEGIIWAIAGQAYNEEISLIDESTGMINADVYVCKDDGMFIPYRKGSMVSADKVLANDVTCVFSQGDIILEDYEATADCTKDGGTFSGRSAIGMIEPGHYVVVVAENATKNNRGISLYTLAMLLKDRGCISAYSFDYGCGPFNVIQGEYIYEADVKDENLSKYNQILYYSAD